MRRSIHLSLLLLSLTLFASPSHAAKFIVTNASNAGAGSLRQAVQDAAAGDTVIFQTGFSGTVALTSPITINKNLVIDGGDGSGGMVRISGGGSARIFEITAGNVNLFNLIFENANGPNDGGAIRATTSGLVNIDTCAFRNNTTVSGSGGAMFNAAGCSLTVRNSTFSNNVRAIANSGPLTMANVTITNNAGAHAIAALAALTLTNCTIFDNPTANENLSVSAFASATNTIFQSVRINSGGTLNASHCLVFLAPNVLSGGTYSPSETIQGFNPLLEPLANNGGKTETKALQSGSPAWRAGTSTGAPSRDQRGFERPNNPSIGAFDSIDPTSIFVLNNANNGPGSLRQTVDNALDGDTLIFNPALSGQTITLTSGEIPINVSLTIRGLGANNLAVSGNNDSRVFRVRGEVFVAISGLTIRNGRSTSASDDGLGIFVTESSLRLDSCEIRDCENAAGGKGIGLCLQDSFGEIYNCTFSGNTGGTGSQGGALAVDGNGGVSVINSTFAGNSAAEGGAIAAFSGYCDIQNSTIAGNSATTAGGGIFVDGSDAYLNNTIVATNAAPTVPDIAGEIQTTRGFRAGDAGLFSARIQRAKFEKRFAARPFSIHSGGASRYNLIGNGSGMTGLVNADADSNLVGTGSSPINPNLAALANNGGSVRTRALNAGSPAIDKGNPAPNENFLATDQRGGSFVRVSNGRMDIGAFEVQATSGVIARDVVTLSTTTLPASGTGITIDLSGIESDFSFIERIRFNSAAPNLNSIEPVAATPQTGGAFIPNRVSPERYWTISNSAVFFVSATLNIDLAGIGGIVNPNRLLIVRRASPLHLWQAVNTSHSSNILSATFDIDDFYGDFAIASLSTENPLPVELGSFSARNVERGVELRWTTASEQNNAGFEVQRRMENREAGMENDWKVLGFVKGKGTTSEAQSYSFLDRTASGKVEYRLKQIDFDGQFEYSPVIEADAGVPRAFELSQNYPNPFNPTTVISYQLPVASEVSLKVYDVLGREVATLVNARQDAGRYQATFNASNLASGLYFYRLQAGAFAQTKKMTLVK